MCLNKLKIIVVAPWVTVLLAAGGTDPVLAYQAVPEKKEKEQQPGTEKKSAAADKDDEEGPIRPGRFLEINATGTVKEGEIQGMYYVDAKGEVNLGLGYGTVTVEGLTAKEAEVKILKHLKRILKSPGVSVKLLPEYTTLVNRVQRLEKEVRELRSLVAELRKKSRN